MKQTRFWIRKFYRRAVQEIGSRFYVNPDPDMHKSILIAGTARSGTTWLGDLIASQIPSRILFEPFNPDLVPEYSGFRYFQYMRPHAENTDFEKFAERVFTGTIRNRWIDHQNERIHSGYRVIKEIRINLALKWLHGHFPQVPILFLMRHPCAVVASRMELGWATDSDIEPFLTQSDLLEDHLFPYVDLIKSVETAEEKHAVIWCISNLIPLRQFAGSELTVVHYEFLCTQPEMELARAFTSIGQPHKSPCLDQIHQPSQTTRITSAVVSGTDKLTHWKKKFSPMQIKNILQVVEAFGLNHLYDDSFLPVDTYGS